MTALKIQLLLATPLIFPVLLLTTGIAQAAVDRRGRHLNRVTICNIL